ncbi:MAG TPA: DUF4350 domain-containing protein [Burkholderiales bacterium]|nr:DUF4350 domain-containing protein [Burkholderiales bacterium]
MTRYIWAVVLGALAIAGGAWWYYNFEEVTVREFVGFSGEAARNPLYALERLAQQMGAQATTVRRAGDLDSIEGGATLVLAARRDGMTPARVARIMSWVGNGGRLVVEAEPVKTRDALLDAFRVGRREAASTAEFARVKLPGDEREFRVVLRPMGLFGGTRDGYSARWSDTATALLQFDHGAGSVTVLPSLGFMGNTAIGQPDHAAFAWALLGLGAGAAPRVTRVFVAPRFERPSLLAWLFDEALGAVIAAAALLALWLARAIPRFGPIVSAHEGARRRLLDHLRATGRFQWSARAAPRLLAAAREECLANIARARPALAYLDAAERSARFAELAGLPRADVELALTGDAATPRHFVTAIATLQAIEEKLARRAAV